MIYGLLKDIIKMFDFNIKDSATIVIFVIFGVYVYNMYNITASTNNIVSSIETRYFDDIEYASSVVLSSMKTNRVETVEQINSFFSQKPAGKTDLMKGLKYENTYCKLEETYGDLAKTAKQALMY